MSEMEPPENTGTTPAHHRYRRHIPNPSVCVRKVRGMFVCVHRVLHITPSPYRPSNIKNLLFSPLFQTPIVEPLGRTGFL